MPPATGSRRYRFDGFTLSPARRVLVRDDREVPLTPRCFDLLVLLVERRDMAVSRPDILDSVWRDVVVSDGALSQAVRTLRRALGDDHRKPTYIRTVPRFGYRFVPDDVVEAPDVGPLETKGAGVEQPDGGTDREEALDTLLGDRDEGSDLRRRRAAESLHHLGTPRALGRLRGGRGHARARAYLRETRWDVPGAGNVPLFGHPAGIRAGMMLLLLRIRSVAGLAGRRCLAATVGGATAGATAGFLGGLVLRFGPGSTAGDVVLAMLPLLGSVVGGGAAAGVGAGLSGAEAAFRSWRGPALVAAGASAGLAVGVAAHVLTSLFLEGLFGIDASPLSGAVEGLALGGAAGLGYAMATPTAEGGMASPRGLARVRVALSAGAACALTAALLAWDGRMLGAMSLDFMAQNFPASQVDLGPLARLLGESVPGTATRIAIGAFEGLMFGSGLAFGLTTRPR